MSKERASARERARAQIAARMAAIAEREKANEADLAVLFDAADRLLRFERARDAAIRAARQHYAQQRDDVGGEQAAAVRRLRERGETVATIARMTGEPASEIRRMMQASTRIAEGTPAPDEVETVGGGDAAGVA